MREGQVVKRIAVMAVAVWSASASANVARPPPPEPNGRGIPMDIVDEPPMRRPVTPPAPSPVAEVTAHASGLVGTWSCSGEPLVIALDLDNTWVVLRAGARVAYRSYDPVAKQWTQLVMGAGGAVETEVSPGEDKGAWTFASAAVREREARTNDGLVLMREERRDGAWVTTYEASCVTSSPAADTPKR